ncbi:MAG: creatininase family protein, partial [Nitrospinota bacterium]
MEEAKSLFDLTQPEAEAILKRRGLVVLPLGSVEQHGPHLPCGTDSVASLVIGRRLAARVGGLLLPVFPLGVSPFHMSFPGTLSLEPETFISVLFDVCKSVHRHGARKFVFLNWHEGNTPALNLAAGRVQRELEGTRVLVAQAHSVAKELYGGEVGLTHGGELEVLPVLLYDPSLVHLERATNPSPEAAARLADARRRGRAVYPILRDIREIAPTGWYGELKDVSRERAEEVVDGVAEAIARAVEE